MLQLHVSRQGNLAKSIQEGQQIKRVQWSNLLLIFTAMAILQPCYRVLVQKDNAEDKSISRQLKT